MYRAVGEPDRFYGVFTTSSFGLTGSAICGFTLQDIQEAFRGKFKEQATSTSAWLPVLTSKVPEPRPGECVNNTESLPGRRARRCSSCCFPVKFITFLKNII